METQVLIIGGGATGTAVARDLALRGIACVLVERHDLNAGASGRNHGLLHSGARYVSKDRDTAIECREEGALLKRLAPHCIQDTGGYFVAVAGDDEHYVAAFPELCARAGIAARAVPVVEAREREPALSERTTAVFEVPDASIDPFMLSLDSMAQAEQRGARLLRRTELVALERDGAGRSIRAARVRDTLSGEERRIGAELVVNAAGAWARRVAALAGADVPMVWSKGTLVVTHARLAHRVINRLRPPSDADIVMPGGTVSIAGTTSTTVQDLDSIEPTVQEVDLIIEEAAEMLPVLDDARCIRAYSGVRPLVSAGGSADSRAVSRGFALIDHARDGIPNLVTITGGKLTSCRLMAERTADLVAERLGVRAPCKTREEPLPSAAVARWTKPGLAPQTWMRDRARVAEDSLICECEMVSRATLEAIAAELGGARHMVLADLALRSRMGKGACQGTFCTVRAIAHLYYRGVLAREDGLRESIDFLRERWRGLRSVLWGDQLAQAELAEAIHCGLQGEELGRHARSR